jgi:hypothetical protein
MRLLNVGWKIVRGRRKTIWVDDKYLATLRARAERAESLRSETAAALTDTQLATAGLTDAEMAMRIRSEIAADPPLNDQGLVDGPAVCERVEQLLAERCVEQFLADVFHPTAS